MASTTFTDNITVIYADWLNDVNNAVYNGVLQANTFTTTNLVVNGTATGAGFTNLVNNTLVSPGAIGSSTPNTGRFTTLQSTGNTNVASLTVLGTTNLTGAIVGGNLTFTNGSIQNYAPGLGTGGQAWGTPSRAYNTVYTNSAGYPIMVNITVTTLAGTAAQLQVETNAGSGSYQVVAYDSGSTNITSNLSAIVQANCRYQVVTTGTPTLQVWAELR